ncbi:sensor histidine kinase [Streptomyces sp. ISL-94]|uniref:sensor histidine kinase n=1 Tax=Streptomyces sp. ISL-94 TaxID=2819190 RepID=UPI001BE618D5|nr:histidine kinase [Streptomyces sp. ISL-94]MBT2478028.1 histidine kinase [Streptomyces sp. ISL-94]
MGVPPDGVWGRVRAEPGSGPQGAPAPAAAPVPTATLRLQANALQALCRQVCAFRMVMIALGAPLTLTLGRTAPGVPTYLVAGAAVLTFFHSYVLFRDRERFGPLLLRHRSLLAVDMAVTGLLLVTATPTSPLVFVAVCTPLLAGLVYGWRGSAPWAAGQACAVAALGTLSAGALMLAALCLLAGAAGACLRDLLLRFGAARARLAAAEAVRAERDHLAREMHDSVAKTLHGLALAADALSRTTDPEAIRRHADLIAGAARRAATESRELLTDLRRDPDPDRDRDPGGPGVSLAAELRARIASSGSAELRVSGPLPVLPTPVARHLLAVASEALENAHRHAGGSGRITVEAGIDGSHLYVAVEDDGCGLPAEPPGPGRFGLLGMRERAAAIGAALRIGPHPGGGPGTQVRLALPLAALAEGGR